MRNPATIPADKVELSSTYCATKKTEGYKGFHLGALEVHKSSYKLSFVPFFLYFFLSNCLLENFWLLYYYTYLFLKKAWLSLLSKNLVSLAKRWLDMLDFTSVGKRRLQTWVFSLSIMCFFHWPFSPSFHQHLTLATSHSCFPKSIGWGSRDLDMMALQMTGC